MQYMPYIVPAFALGLAGSLHCVGMCGPIALALTPDAGTRRKIAAQSLAYNSGRVLTYALLGSLFGLLGKGIAVAGMQQVVSLVAGGLMIAMAFFALGLEENLLKNSFYARFSFFIKGQLGQLMRKGGSGSSFGIGILNGLLPCGMVYAAVAGAVTTTSGAEGALFMAFFGLGTMPMMMGVSVAGRVLGLPLRQKLKKVQPILLTVIGILFIYRGLHLDLSWFESVVPKAELDCH